VNPMKSSTGVGVSLTMVGTSILTLLVLGLSITGHQDKADALQAESGKISMAFVTLVGAIGAILSVYGKVRSNRILDKTIDGRVEDVRTFIRKIDSSDGPENKGA